MTGRASQGMRRHALEIETEGAGQAPRGLAQARLLISTTALVGPAELRRRNERRHGGISPVRRESDSNL
jgi:hypothetical protein